VLTQFQTPTGGWHTTSYVGQPGSSLSAVSCTPTFFFAANSYGWLLPNKATQGAALPTPRAISPYPLRGGVGDLPISRYPC
jgi:hypothetical protein